MSKRGESVRDKFEIDKLLKRKLRLEEQRRWWMSRGRIREELTTVIFTDNPDYDFIAPKVTG